MNCDTIIIDGVLYNYQFTQDNLHIEDSCKISKRHFEQALFGIETKHPALDVWKRTKKSLKREWATHNLLHALCLWMSRTKDVDLNYPQRYEWLYTITGTIALLFIK